MGQESCGCVKGEVGRRCRDSSAQISPLCPPSLASPCVGFMPYQAVVHPEPPDGGWGWMVVLAAFIQSALVFGVIRSFGVFFVEFVEYFDELSRRISWITSIGIAVQQFVSEWGGAWEGLQEPFG